MSNNITNLISPGLLEYSVVYTDRSLNHMSQKFQGVMKDISASLKKVYNSDHAVVIPGGGTFAMEAVARQFATDKPCLVLRNGWFSYRWTQIFEAGNIPSSVSVLKARTNSENSMSSFIPAPVEEVTKTIKSEKPKLVFATHVETACGMLLPDDYIEKIAQATHDVGGLLILDCVASGAIWIDMKACGVDVLITAPQKGWTSTPCAGIVMLNEAAHEVLQTTQSSSFAGDLKAWHKIMKTYESGSHAYHATMPTDSLVTFRDVILETEEFGFDLAKEKQIELGMKVRQLFSIKGVISVAATGFQSPSVIVCFTQSDAIQKGIRFAEHGIQIAAGVPLMCDESEDFKSFRIGLFGLDKLKDVDSTVQQLEKVIDDLF